MCCFQSQRLQELFEKLRPFWLGISVRSCCQVHSHDLVPLLDRGSKLFSLLRQAPRVTVAVIQPLRAGKIHFMKFETAKIDQAIDFIMAKGLHRITNGANGLQEHVQVKATGGGAYKFAEIFQVGAALGPCANTDKLQALIYSCLVMEGCCSELLGAGIVTSCLERLMRNPATEQPALLESLLLVCSIILFIRMACLLCTCCSCDYFETSIASSQSSGLSTNKACMQ